MGELVAPRRAARSPRGAEAASRLVGGAGWLLVAVAAWLAVYPSVVLLASSLVAGGRVGLDHYARALSDPGVHQAFGNSLVVSTAAAAAGTALGVLLAWLTTRTDLPGAGAWHAALVLPYMIPPFIGAIAWVYLLGPVGYLNRLWMWLSGSADPLLVVYGPGGIVFALALYGYPVPYLVVRGALERMNPALEEAARMSGAGPLQVLRDVVAPLVLPAVASGALLLWVSSLANFGIPAVLGFPARYFVLPTRIYGTVLNFDLPENLRVAAALSVLLAAPAGLALWVQRQVAQARGSRFAVVTGQGGAGSRTELGRWRGVACAFLVAVVAVATVLPLGAILLTSLTRAYGVPLGLDNLTVDHYRTVLFGIPKVARALRNSLLLAAAAATLVVVLAAAVAYLSERLRWRAGRMLEGVLGIPYAVPGTVVAVAMILAYARPLPVIHLRLYDTAWILLVAYLARFLAVGLRTVSAGLAQVHASLEEAARIGGAGPGKAFRDVVVPIIWPSVRSAWVLVFIPAVAELTLSALLYSVGNETVGVVIYGLHEEGKVTLSAALAFVVTAVLLVGHLLAQRTPRREWVS
jgi:iron(III) transport system permease protein